MPEATYLCSACGARFPVSIASHPGPGVVACSRCGRTTARRQAVPAVGQMIGGCVSRPVCAAGLELGPASLAGAGIRDQEEDLRR